MVTQKGIVSFRDMLLLAEVTRRDIDAAELVNLVLGVGELGVKAMALLDKANTTAYGNPEITKVNIGVRNHPAFKKYSHSTICLSCTTLPGTSKKR